MSNFWCVVVVIVDCLSVDVEYFYLLLLLLVSIWGSLLLDGLAFPWVQVAYVAGVALGECVVFVLEDVLVVDGGVMESGLVAVIVNVGCEFVDYWAWCLHGAPLLEMRT